MAKSLIEERWEREDGWSINLTRRGNKIVFVDHVPVVLFEVETHDDLVRAMQAHGYYEV